MDTREIEHRPLRGVEDKPNAQNVRSRREGMVESQALWCGVLCGTIRVYPAKPPLTAVKTVLATQ